MNTTRTDAARDAGRGLAMKIYTLKGEYTRERVETVLGPPSLHWPWSYAPRQAGESVCGLANVETQSAGYGDTRACCRVHIHPDGVCIYPPAGALVNLFVEPEKDQIFAEAVYNRLRQAREETPGGRPGQEEKE